MGSHICIQNDTKQPVEVFYPDKTGYASFSRTVQPDELDQARGERICINWRPVSYAQKQEICHQRKWDKNSMWGDQWDAYVKVSDLIASADKISPDQEGQMPMTPP